MWPWAHAALAYLLYTTYHHLHNSHPTHRPTVALLIGSQLPDLIDKPLAWTLQLLPHGRSLMHSAITATILTTAIAYIATTRDHPAPYYAFAAGVWAHLLGDALPTTDHLAYLAWPLLEPTPPELEPSFIAHFDAITLTPWFLTQLALTVLALIVWYHDGTPGLTRLDPR